MTTPSKSHGRKAIRLSVTPRDLMTPTPDLVGAWEARILTLFPNAFPGVLGESLTGKALQDGRWRLETYDLRDFGIGKHRNVDDTPAGGGAGMVLRPDVVGPAIEKAMEGTTRAWPLIYLSPRGAPMTQGLMQRLARADGVTLICGRFDILAAGRARQTEVACPRYKTRRPRANRRCSSSPRRWPRPTMATGAPRRAGSDSCAQWPMSAARSTIRARPAT